MTNVATWQVVPKTPSSSDFAETMNFHQWKNVFGKVSNLDPTK